MELRSPASSHGAQREGEPAGTLPDSSQELAGLFTAPLPSPADREMGKDKGVCAEALGGRGGIERWVKPLGLLHFWTRVIVNSHSKM